MNCKFYTNVQVMGDTVFVREVVDGISSLRKDKWSPSIYVKGQPKDPLALSVKTLYGDDAYEMLPGSIRETKDFVSQYKGVSGFEIFGQLNYSLQYMNLYPVSNWSAKNVSIWAIDIETNVPVDENGKTYFPDPKNVDGEILLITMINMNTGEAYTFGSRPYSGTDTHYTTCATEKQLLQLFLQFWEQRKVDIITGWNTNQFDLPYIINRTERILGKEYPNKLSPWGKASCRTKEFNGKEEFQIDILGVACLDYIDLYKKYIFVKQESYSLGHIAQEELGTTKVDHSEYGSFNDFHLKAWNKFTHYNIIDTVLIKQLDDKLKLIELVMTMAYEAKVNYDDVASPVKTWDAIISNYCLSNGIVLPQQKKESSKQLDGAYVKEPVPGWYNNVVSLDAVSLYPSIIMTNNISPETYLGSIDTDIDTFLKMPDHNVEKENVVTPVGAIYSKEKRGILPTLVDRFMKMRREAKNEMLRLEQELEDLEKQIAELQS
jgi:DNA polymerase elongation subunit (family B)